MIFIAGISIAIFIEILLISKKNKSEGDKILILWMDFTVFHLFLFYLTYTNVIYDYPFLLGIELPMPIIQAIFLYLYVGSMTHQLPKNRKLLLFHFIPATVAYIYLISFFSLPSSEKINIFKNDGIGYETFLTILHYVVALAGIIYIIWSIILIRRHKRNILHQFSDLEKVDLLWLKVQIWSMGGIWILVIFINDPVFIFSGVVVFVFLISFFGIRQGNISVTTKPTENDKVSKEKYAKSGLKEDMSEKLYQKLRNLIKEETLYKNGELTIGELATKLEVHPNYLSQIINERENKNFYEYINSYRLEEFKRLIDIPKNQNLTLLSLAYDCGFNSKSSFNRYFKKATGQTPSQYFTSITKE